MQDAFPHWLGVSATIALGSGITSALIIAADLVRRPQSMLIMNVVWPLTALFGGLLWLAFYFGVGRASSRKSAAGETAMVWAVAKGTCHCGAGCALGDLIAEWLAFFFPSVAIALGWESLFREKMFAVWIFDLVLAFGLGILFQYYSIVPMRDLSPREGLVQAVKADAASILAWQVGMYGFMAAAQLLWLKPIFGEMAQIDTPEFWFLMQIAMLCGFCTSYPVNWALIRAGVKERM